MNEFADVAIMAPREIVRGRVACGTGGRGPRQAQDRTRRTVLRGGGAAPAVPRSQRAARPTGSPSDPAVPRAVQQSADLFPPGGGGRGRTDRASRRCGGDRRRRGDQRHRRLHPGRQGGEGAERDPQDDLAARQRLTRRSARERAGCRPGARRHRAARGGGPGARRPAPDPRPRPPDRRGAADRRIGGGRKQRMRSRPTPRSAIACAWHSPERWWPPARGPASWWRPAPTPRSAGSAP